MLVFVLSTDGVTKGHPWEYRGGFSIIMCLSLRVFADRKRDGQSYCMGKQKNISKACEHIPVFSELWTQFRKGKVRNQNLRLLNSRHESAPFTRVEILSHSLVKLKSLAFKTPHPNYQLAKHFNHMSERVFEEEICGILTKLLIVLIYSFRRRV